MPDIHRIERIILSDFQQFPLCHIDLRDSVTGEPLDEVCFLGVNGTGKSSILEQLYRSVLTGSTALALEEESKILTVHRIGEEAFVRVRTQVNDEWFCIPEEHLEEHFTNEADDYSITHFSSEFSSFVVARPELPTSPISFFSSSASLTGLEEAEEFEEFLETRLKERSHAYREFLRKPENRSKTVEEVDRDFAENFAGVLDSLNDIWDRVLKQASLQFDPDGKGTLFSSVTGKEISFSRLSPGMQNFLLRLGHVFCQYHHHEEPGGFLFLDEPETGLHPELQVNLINLYRSIIGSHFAQLFVASHSPHIASQFEADSRVILSFKDDGRISPSRGVAEEGADPNRILRKDFGLKKQQPKKKDRSKRAIPETKEEFSETCDRTELADLIDEIVTRQ